MISKKTKYGLKALIHVARLGYQERVHIATIAEKESIPRKFLESIMLELRKAGYLASRKGKGGGYYLLKKPDKISISEIYRLLEGPIAPVPCVSLNFYEKCDDCDDEAKCKIHLLMVQVRDRILSIYNNTFISDLIN
ncbi:MAG: Rrf2 family transcriptional regulator [Ekhidna sp.]|nr:Rrf2 family transcriptional regulator [Ekhidna sp.]MBC6411021.1 Rrf2 family transcriptional regulator [Ekhidna sp.]